MFRSRFFVPSPVLRFKQKVFGYFFFVLILINKNNLMELVEKERERCMFGTLHTYITHNFQFKKKTKMIIFHCITKDANNYGNKAMGKNASSSCSLWSSSSLSYSQKGKEQKKKNDEKRETCALILYYLYGDAQYCAVMPVKSVIYIPKYVYNNTPRYLYH